MDWSWAIGGVNHSTPRVAGSDCVYYMTNRRRIIENIIATIFFAITLKCAINRLPILNLPSYSKPEAPHRLLRRILLVTMTLVFGIEMGFKLSTRSVIYVLNPCHITTMIQIYILAAKPTKTTTALFRIQMNYLNGPLLAFIFPEADSRALPLELFTYWVQHGLLYIIPCYLLMHGDPFKMEDFMDFKWNIIGYSILMLYHFILLSATSMAVDVNLNHMLCAAVSDPFQGQNYRIAAVIHQGLLCPILCKLTAIIFANTKQINFDVKITNKSEAIYDDYNNQTSQIIDDHIMTTKID